MHGLRDGPFSLFHLPGGWMGCGVGGRGGDVAMAWYGRYGVRVVCTYM